MAINHEANRGAAGGDAAIAIAIAVGVIGSTSGRPACVSAKDENFVQSAASTARRVTSFTCAAAGHLLRGR